MTYQPTPEKVMIFEFLGNKKKAVIAMAHIGALPGAPLYDAKGGSISSSTMFSVM
jgi:predicted TIM-barrel enzyme